MASAPRVLIRTTTLDASVRVFASEIAAASACPVAIAADGRYVPEQSGELPVIRVTAGACAALGLHCPEDFAWRCGDYAYYLARERFPEAPRFWVIEADVRFDGDPRTFFAFFESRPEIDFLASQLQPADRGWFWTDTAAARDVDPYRCLFPVTRLSARAIEAALNRRRKHSRRALRRALWPNDEALIATTLVNGRFLCHDFNDFGREFYSADTFSFVNPMDGGRLRLGGPSVRMLHPVLFGEAYAAKLQAQREQPRPGWLEREWRRTVSRLNRRLPW